MSELSRGRIAIIVIVVILLLVGIITPIVYFTTKKDATGTEEGGGGGGEEIPPEKAYSRLDCFPEAIGGVEKVTREKCERRNCIYQQTTMTGVPICFFRDEHGYSVTKETHTPLGLKVDLSVKGTTPFGNGIRHIVFSVEMLDDHLIRFKFDDPIEKRYTVPKDMEVPSTKAMNPLYEFKITNRKMFAFQIIRKSTKKVLWDTSVGGLTFADQFLQIATKLPSPHVYGFGENLHHSFRHDLAHRTWPMFARDQPPGWKASSNLYGVHPFYTCMEGDGNAHGVLLLNSNAQDYSFTPLPMLTYRTTGGILDFYVFLGPDPEAVVQQYTKAIGRPYLPPYWALGFQLCKYGYKTLETMQEAVNRTRRYNIPHDVQYNDIDTFDERKDFTIDNVSFAGLNDYFKQLRNGGMRIVTMLDPFLIANVTDYEPYELMKANGANIMWPSEIDPPANTTDETNALLGFCWPKGKVVYPDFFKEATKKVWKKLIVDHRERLMFDGIWIDMNEPANFGTNLEKPWNWPESAKPYWSLQCPKGNRFEDPPYRTMASYLHDENNNGNTRLARLSDKTICMIARQGENNEYWHYDVHSLYGWSQTLPTLDAARAATKERSLVISRSTFPGSGKYGGHWLGDNNSEWPHLHESIIGMLEFNLFGIPYIGADIGGFFGNATAQLCKRWMQLGAFYPFSRNHNGYDSGPLFMHPQDPGYFGDEVAEASRKAMETRYLLLPYLYTLFYKAHAHGNTVVRPIHHEFPSDLKTYGIDRQFMWGPALLITPILEKDQTKLDYYLPSAKWYDFFAGWEFPGPSSKTMDITASSKPLLHVRGGHILPMQQHANNTYFSRQKPMKLFVALDADGAAVGQLFWDDGVSEDTVEKGNYYLARFSANKDSLSMSIEHNTIGEADGLIFDTITIYGMKETVGDVILQETYRSLTFKQTSEPKVLIISNISLPIHKPFQLLFREESDISERSRIDCHPEVRGGVEKDTPEACDARGCTYTKAISGAPSCYFPQDGYGYSVKAGPMTTEMGFKITLERRGTSPYGKDIKDITFSVEYRDDNVLRFTLDDEGSSRYRVPVELDLPNVKARDPKYDIMITNHTLFSFKIVRKSTGTVLWDTSVGGLTFADQFLQIATRLPSRHIYGFGENVHHSFRHDMWHRSWPMFGRDQAIGWGEERNHYGVHPYYMCMENDGHAHGVLLLNSNAQDYTFSPLPMLTYKTIGGVLDFYMFLGPEPENVVQQYTEAIGKPYMPPYWSLGFQLCRYGYNSLENLKAAVDRTKDAQIPHDVQYADIDHMDERMDFTIDNVNFAGLPEYFQTLRDGGMHTVIILDPTLITNVSGYEPYEQMRDADANIKWPETGYEIPANSSDSKNAMLGFVWPKGKVVFPDFFKNVTKEIWQNLIIKHHDQIQFDGLWIDMNEPANFGTNLEKPWNWPVDATPYWSLQCANHTYDDPPYRTMAAYIHDNQDTQTKARLSDKTLCMVARQGENDEYSHYDVHSLYGWSHTKPTLDGLRKATGERGIVISRSTFVGSGKYAGHWLGDNDSKWPHLSLSIIGILEFNLFGIPYIGADICGFFQNSTSEMCMRWMQLGAFYTFSRNHNDRGGISQDPGIWGEEVAKLSREAIETRYWLLPYLYTLFHNAHVRGNTVIRPLHHEFPSDIQTYDIDKQFLWGPALLISPILEEGQKELSMYLPMGTWYIYYDGQRITDNGRLYTLMEIKPDSAIPLHIRGGYILPMQKPANNTNFSRQNPFTICVALASDGRRTRAEGELFWDDGSSIDTFSNGNYYFSRFTADEASLVMTIQKHNTSAINNLHIDTIRVFGVDMDVKYVYIKGSGDAHTGFTYNSISKVLIITDIQVAMSMDFIIEWRSSKIPTDAESARLDCLPDSHLWKDQSTECLRRGCRWKPQPDDNGVPACYIDNARYGYSMTASSKTGNLVDLEWKNQSRMFVNDIRKIQLAIEQLTDNILNFKFYDPNVTRYEVPVPLQTPTKSPSTTQQYDIEYGNDVNNAFYLRIKRKSTGTIIWDTSVGGLTFADQFLQIATKLPSKNIFGFGENRHFNFRHSVDFKTWPMFARDNGVNWGDYANLYGVHPFYMCLEDAKGNAHAVLLLNSNAMEVKLQPLPALTYRTVGGILDFYVFLGPEPETVISQYSEVIGTPYMPPYWSLGFQLCKYGYNNLETLKEAVDRTTNAGIPHDVQYADIDHMDTRMDFTWNPTEFGGLPDYIREQQSKGMHFIIILDPALITNVSNYEPYLLGLQKDVFVKWKDGVSPDFHVYNTSDMLGWVWPEGKVVFPDFFKPETKEYWIELIVKHHQNISFDGLWIDMNEPANFGTNDEKPFNWPAGVKPYWTLKCPKSDLDDPPYKPNSVFGARLSDKTLCMAGLQNNSQLLHYNVHSLYGWSQTEPTLAGLRRATNKRGIVISRSTYPSSGRWAGHWLGDNDSQWHNMHDSIIGIMEFNLFGIPYVGADMCGFFGDSTPELCQRWMQLGAFYTFSRNHNTINTKPQDPAYFGQAVADSSRRVLEIRYSLLPYLYTLFYRVHTLGGTVLRSLLHEFPKDMKTWHIDSQFMWGPGFMIAPALEIGKKTVNVYFPEDRWFDFYTGSEVAGQGVTHTVDAPRDHIPLFIRGGHILPTQKPANTTVFSRQNTMGLIIAPDLRGEAFGELFWDDGDSIDTIANNQYFLAKFTFKKSRIDMGIEKLHDSTRGLTMDTLRILGVDSAPVSVTSNSMNHSNFTFFSHLKVLLIEDLQHPMTNNFTVSWT